MKKLLILALLPTFGWAASSATEAREVLLGFWESGKQTQVESSCLSSLDALHACLAENFESLGMDRDQSGDGFYYVPSPPHKNKPLTSDDDLRTALAQARATSEKTLWIALGPHKSEASLNEARRRSTRDFLDRRAKGILYTKII